MKKILLVEDDASLCRGISFKLKKEGYEVLTSPTVKDAIVIFENNKIDLVISDITLEDGDGYELCQKIRQNSDVLFIFLTALDQEVDMVTGYDLGADDYITKPVRVRELIARINAVSRRRGINKENNTDKIITRDLIVYPLKYEVYKGEEKLQLTSAEYKLLLLLLKNKGNVLTRKQLLEKLWDVEGDFIEEKTLTVYIKRLREKLLEDKDNKYIETVRGIGYKWLDEE